MSTPAGDDLVGNATIRVDGDTDPATRALQRFSRDAQGRLRDVRGRFVAESALINRTITNNTPTLTVNTAPATNTLNQFTRDANGRLRDVRGRFVRAGDDISRTLTRATGNSDGFSLSLRGLADAARTAGGVLGRVGLGIAGLGAAAGTAAPLLAGIVTTLENIGPASAVAVTGMLAVKQASAAIQLGMIGVEDAVTAAFDTSEAGAKKFDKALRKLSPNAHAFADQVKELRPTFKRFQQGIQNALFADFDQILRDLSEHTLPILRRNLTETATTLNFMGQSVNGAVLDLSLSGRFGKALDGANRGLASLTQVPGQVVTALGQLAVAGAPTFDRLTKAAADAATSFSDRIATAFKTGALEQDVNTAIDVLKDLGTVGGNIFGILGNIMEPVQDAGGGFVGILEKITGALREATAKEGFQSAIGALAEVMGTVARTVGPLLGQALAAIGPVFTTLGPPVERLIKKLGAALSPIIKALGPVLAAAAGAVGVLVDALSPLLPVVGKLIASLLPPLVPAIQAIAQAWAGAAPIVAQLGQILTAVLAPVIAQLPTVLTPLINTFTQVTAAVLPLVSQLLTALTPALTTLGKSFASLLVGVGPLLGVLGQLIGIYLSAIIPLLTPIITLVGQLASVLARQLASTINNLVVPALRFVTDLLRGDFTGAWDSLKTLFTGVWQHITTTMDNIKTVVSGVIQTIIGIFQHLYDTLVGNSIIPDLVLDIVSWFGRLPGMAFKALASLAGRLRDRASEAGSALLKALRDKIGDAVEAIKGLPARAREGLSNLAGYLASAGRDLIAGMISGVREKAGDLVSAAKDVVGSAIDGAKSLLGISSPSKVFAGIGQDTGRGFIEGLAGMQRRVTAAVSDVAASVPESFTTSLAPAFPSVRAVPDLGVSSMRTSSGTGTTVITQNLYFENQGVIGSPIELDAWLARSLDRLAQQRRLPASLRRAVG